MSARLALPPSPGPGAPAGTAALAGEATPISASGPITVPMQGEPVVLMAPPGMAARAGALPADSLQMRSMTATASVEPLAYASGTMPPVVAYGHPPLVRSRRRSLAIAGTIAAGVALIGVIAMITTGDRGTRGGAPTPTAAGIATTDGDARGGAAAGAVDPAVDPDDSDRAGGAPDPAEAHDDDHAAPEDKQPEPAIEPPATDAAVAKQPEPAVVKAPDPVVKKPDPVVKKPDPVVKKPDPVVKKPDPVVRKKPDPVVKKSGNSVDAARKKAQSQYASKDFAAAASTARDAAGSADGADATALRKLASDYDALAKYLRLGDAAAATKATDALTAYKRALSTDKRLGGTHASMIRDKLGQVAPKAAAGFMAKGNYEAAKQAADTAVNFGAGSSPTVAQVRQSLERKAAELYGNGMKLMKTKPDEGRAMLRRVLKIVPPDSPSYVKAYKAVNARGKARDDDE